MATNIVDIDQVEPDIDPMEVGVVSNPLDEDFEFAYAGKPLVIPATHVEEVADPETGKVKKLKVAGKKQFPLYVAVHMAKHLAEKIIRAEFRKRIAGIKDPKEKETESGKPIPDYKGKIWAKMKELVETESHFFDDAVDGDPNSNKEKFIR